MKGPLLLALLIVQAISTPLISRQADEPSTDSSSFCACDLDVDGRAKEWSYNIWLDIVLVVDTSKSMEPQGLTDVAGLISSFISMMNLDSTKDDTQFSRIGLIIVTDNGPEVVYNLNMSSDSVVEFIRADSVEVDITAGFQAALKMLEDGKGMSNYRPSAKQVVYMLSNSIPQFNHDYQNFKDGGGIVMVSNILEDAGEWEQANLRDIASPNYFFTNLTTNYNYNLQIFCDANCFCPASYQSFATGKNPRQLADGGCFHVAETGDTEISAQKSCASDNALLVSIHDDEKQFYVTGLVGPKEKYWLGLINDGSQWNWEDKSKSSYNNWDDGQPITNGTADLCAYAVQTTGFNTKWYATNCEDVNANICEKAPCSTDNYCV